MAFQSVVMVVWCMGKVVAMGLFVNLANLVGALSSGELLGRGPSLLF